MTKLNFKKLLLEITKNVTSNINNTYTQTVIGYSADNIVSIELVKSNQSLHFQNCNINWNKLQIINNNTLEKLINEACNNAITKTTIKTLNKTTKDITSTSV